MGNGCCKQTEVEENNIVKVEEEPKKEIEKEEEKQEGTQQPEQDEPIKKEEEEEEKKEEPSPATSAVAAAGAAPEEKKERRKGPHSVVVCLMMENRSLDNLLGYLYTEEELGVKGDGSKVIESAKHFNGLVGKDLSNPIPEEAQEEGGPTEVKAHAYPVTEESYQYPNPDPGEEYPHINVQLFDTTLPKTNQGKPLANMEAPYNLPEPVPKEPGMKGFVRDYVQHYELSIDDEENPGYPPYDKFKHIMGSFTPEHVPVISKLAREFCVCDNWFCAVPSQTFCNRSFFISAQSAGNVVNGNIDGEDWVNANNSKTMFDQFDEAGITWAIYYDLEDIFSATLLINYPTLKRYLFTNNFRDMAQFERDAKNGELPQYVFIEPRLLIAQNSYHPPWHGFPSDVRAGDAFVKYVYDNLFGGPQKDDILLTITFDEHGGCYDHVPPPSNVPGPDGENQKPGQYGFMFDRLGLRIPTLFISPYIKKHQVCSKELWHTSWMKSVRDILFKKECNVLKEKYLTQRDRAAPLIPFDDFVDLNTKRDMPELELNPTYNPVDVELAGLQNIHHFAKQLLCAWLALIRDDSGFPLDHSNNERETMVKNIEYFLNNPDATMSEFQTHLKSLSRWSIRNNNETYAPQE